MLCCGTTEDEAARPAGRIGREPDELRENGAAGTPAEVAATLSAYGEAGADTIYRQVLDLDDLDHVALVAEDVAPQLGP